MSTTVMRIPIVDCTRSPRWVRLGAVQHNWTNQGHVYLLAPVCLVTTEGLVTTVTITTC